MADAGKVPMGPFVELSFALQEPVTLVLSSPKSTVPKSARGRMPPLPVQQGASAINSADVRCAAETVALLVKVFPGVVLWSLARPIGVRASLLDRVGRVSIDAHLERRI